MGWFWSSSNRNDASDNALSTTASPRPPPPPSTPPSAKKIDPKLTGGDEEVAKFLSMIQEANNPPPNRSSPPSPPPPPTSSSSSSSSSSSAKSPSIHSWIPNPFASESDPPAPKPTKARSPQSIAMSEHTLPTDMSCKDAFDYAWHCHTPGSQINSVYRQGGLRTCSDLWDDFWFCMRIKQWPAAARTEAIKDHFRTREEAKYGGGKPSSEDVWESRADLVEPGTAFRKPFDPPITDDKEFERQEAGRRQWLRELDDERKRREGKL